VEPHALCLQVRSLPGGLLDLPATPELALEARTNAATPQHEGGDSEAKEEETSDDEAGHHFGGLESGEGSLSLGCVCLLVVSVWWFLLESAFLVSGFEDVFCVHSYADRNTPARYNALSTHCLCRTFRLWLCP
jgi:hypothetical protein